MFAVYKRDLRAFYTTPIGYVFSGILILIMNLCFYFLNVETSSSNVKPIFYLLLIGLAFLAPILTMRLLSEEKKMKTDQLLFTVMIPLILAAYSVSEPWAIFGNYVAIFFAASAFIAIGLFISSFTENQLVSALVSWTVLIGLWLVDMLVANIEVVAVKTVVSWLSVFSRYSGFTYGLFDLSDIVYYISVAAVFIYLTIRMLDKKRYA